nr:hypothetical protein [Kibdelosporangium sp. MJ126-NF4]
MTEAGLPMGNPQPSSRLTPPWPHETGWVAPRQRSVVIAGRLSKAIDALRRGSGAPGSTADHTH